MQGSIQERVRKKGVDSQGRIRANLKVYDVFFQYKDSAGKMKRASKRGFLTKAEAQSFLLDLNHKLATNTFAGTKVILVKDYLNEWLETYGKTNLRRSSYSGYARIIKQQVIPQLGELNLKELTSSDVDRLYAHLLQKGRADGKGGLSAKSVLYSHRVLNEALSHAVKRQLIYRNPMLSVTNTPKPKKYKGTIYGAEEILHLLEVAKDTVFEVPVALAAICGLRRGECMALTSEDVDFENRTITINKQLVEVDNQVMVTEPKSEDSNRLISAPQEVFDIIERRIAYLEGNKGLLQDEFADKGLLVCRADGTPIRPSYFTKSFSLLLERHGLKSIRFHDLRHSCASLMLNSGVAMKTASQILGHSTIAITADLYTHVMEDAKKLAAVQVGQELFGKKESKPNENEAE